VLCETLADAICTIVILDVLFEMQRQISSDSSSGVVDPAYLKSIILKLLEAEEEDKEVCKQ
jgi:hypothetical protein